MSLARDLLSARDSEVCTIHPDKTVLNAAALMNHCRIGALVVLDRDKIVGIFTERDILARRLQEHEETIKYLHEYMPGSD